MHKIILYYVFVPIADPEAIRLWQRSLCERYCLTGRIIISEHGINGTLGGTTTDLKAYVKATKTYAGFKNMAFKWSDGAGEDFPKLSVKVRPEIVTFGAAEELRVSSEGLIGGGQHLKPAEVHKLVAERGEDVVFFDGRNRHEAAVGRFKNAVVPQVDHTREFITALDSGDYDHLKQKPVVTYCTGGIRCEVLSVLMKNRGFQEVYQMDGGIVRYGETYGDEGLWEGSLYVFDGRMGTKFTDKAVDVGACVHCHGATSSYENCANQACNALMLRCAACETKTMCPDCMQALQKNSLSVTGNKALN